MCKNDFFNVFPVHFKNVIVPLGSIEAIVPCDKTDNQVEIHLRDGSDAYFVSDMSLANAFKTWQSAIREGVSWA